MSEALNEFTVELTNPFSIGHLGTLARMYKYAYDGQSLSDPTWYGGRHKLARLLVECFFRTGLIKSKSQAFLSTESNCQAFDFEDLNTQFHSIYFDRFAYCYEPEVTASISAALRLKQVPRPVLWDVGCNWGHYCFYFFAKLGTTIRCVGFDPRPDCVAFVRGLAERIGADDSILAVAAALGETEANGEFYLPSGFHSGITEVRPAEDRSRTACKIHSGDRIPELRFGVPDVMKIDVEGSERSVLRGIEGLISQSRPVIAVEFFHEGDRRHDSGILHALQDHGYRILAFSFDPTWKSQKTERWNGEEVTRKKVEYAFRTYDFLLPGAPRRQKSNIIACPNELVSDFLRGLEQLGHV